MRDTKKPEHHLLLIWLILTGVILFALVVSWQQAILYQLFVTDKSKISFAICLSYLLISLHCARRVYSVSLQYNLSQYVYTLLNNETDARVNIDNGTVYINRSIALPKCMVTDYLLDRYARCQQRQNNMAVRAGDDSSWIEYYASRLKNPQEIGWFMTDVILKLGLLGTIIGFIFMLRSVTEITDFDAHTMQDILRQMGTGMGIALYTTLTGLVCSILAALQYQLIDQHADGIVNMIQHLAHTCHPNYTNSRKP